MHCGRTINAAAPHQKWDHLRDHVGFGGWLRDTALSSGFYLDVRLPIHIWNLKLSFLPMSISSIDWSKLKPYSHTKQLSFEELCFHIARGLYGTEGWTRVDDSGGGDGVEFYQDRTGQSGAVIQWGWQAKFYHPEGRLEASNRKKSIIGSLKKSCREHPLLEHWFLCTPTNFTPVEKRWFDNDLRQSVFEELEKDAGKLMGKKDRTPQDEADAAALKEAAALSLKVEIEHWGESEFVSWFGEPQFTGQRLYFFGELELSLDWFNRHNRIYREGLGEKFIPELHIESHVDQQLHYFVADEQALEAWDDQVKKLKSELSRFTTGLQSLRTMALAPQSISTVHAELIASLDPLEILLTQEFTKTKDFIDRVKRGQWKESDEDEWKTRHQTAELIIDKASTLAHQLANLRVSGKDAQGESHSDVAHAVFLPPVSNAEIVLRRMETIRDQIGLIQRRALHVLGAAAVGKTHFCAHVIEHKMKVGLPALCIAGRRFTADTPLTTQLKQILDLPASYSWGDFMQALESAALAYETRIPLLIDGLNEAVSLNGGALSLVWERDLGALESDLNSISPSVALVTTCRASYCDAIWSEPLPDFTLLKGFDMEKVEEALRLYFDFYKIEADFIGVSLQPFRNPIYLRIFCEVHNPSRNDTKQIVLSSHGFSEIFEKYVGLCEQSVCKQRGLKKGTLTLQPALKVFAEQLWQRNARSLDVSEVIQVLDGKPREDVFWLKSKTHSLETSNLLVFRDMNSGQEIYQFTYDLLAGYFIAQIIIASLSNDKSQWKTDLNQPQFFVRLFGADQQQLHPLHEDIVRGLSALLPLHHKVFLHDLVDSHIAESASFEALFDISPLQKDITVAEVHRVFENPGNRQLILNLALDTLTVPTHPLNIAFWGSLLRPLSMSERDLCWSETVRCLKYDFEPRCQGISTICRDEDQDIWIRLSERSFAYLHLNAQVLFWTLSSNVRDLRDQATQALYWYGRRFPDHLWNLLEDAWEINDPYLRERLLAAVYGVAMARQYDFADSSFAQNVLPTWARALYEKMFTVGAPSSTTHYLARDYSRRTIDIALLHHPDLLCEEQRERCRPPFPLDLHLSWGNVEPEESENSHLKHSDFANYVLGALIDGRDNHDSSNPDFQMVSRQVAWRIYDLSYSFDQFGDIDQMLHELGTYRETSGKEDGKEDRYLKKYSWIAFWELAGRLEDQVKLPERHEERLSDADIDPSFPDAPRTIQLITADLLGDRSVDVAEWIQQGDIPEVAPYFSISDIDGENGEWVLLFGSINQQDASVRRKTWMSLRGVLIPTEEISQFKSIASNASSPRAICDGPPEDHYTFAGEIPWCTTFPANETEPVALVNNLLVPVRENAWEGHQSSVNVGRRVPTPCRQITQELDLCGQPQTFDLWEKDGCRASVSLSFGQPYDTNQRMCYLRKDLLERYLQNTQQTLFVMTWGERSFFSPNSKDGEQFTAETGKPYVSFFDVKQFGADF